jgi:hypothetical protein
MASKSLLELSADIDQAVHINKSLGKTTAGGLNAVLKILAGELVDQQSATPDLSHKADLDSSGRVPSSQLPSYVDDIVEAARFVALPTPGEAGKVYVTLDTNQQYRWAGSTYALLSDSGLTVDLKAALEASQNPSASNAFVTQAEVASSLALSNELADKASLSYTGTQTFKGQVNFQIGNDDTLKIYDGDIEGTATSRFGWRPSATDEVDVGLMRTGRGVMRVVGPNGLAAVETSDVTAYDAPADLNTLTKLAEGITDQRNRLDTLVAGAPAALDTLQEIADQLAADETGTAAILATQQQHTQQLAGFHNTVVEQNLTSNSTTSVPSVAAINQALATLSTGNDGATSSNIKGIPAYSVVQAGQQNITLPEIVEGIIYLSVLEKTGGVRVLYEDNYSISGNTLTISSEANLMLGDEVRGKYFLSVAATSISDALLAALRNIVRDELAANGGPTIWSSPTVQGFDDADFATFTSVAPMEYCLEGNLQAISDFGSLSGTEYVGTYQVGNVDRAFGYVWVRTKATAEKAASIWTKSPEFHLLVVTNPPNLIISSEDMTQRPPWDGYQSGFYHSQLADPEGTATMNVLSAYDSNASLITNYIDMTPGVSYCFSGIFGKYVDTSSVLETFQIQTQSSKEPLKPSKATFNLTSGAITDVQDATCYMTDLSPRGAQWQGYYLLEMTIVASITSQQFAMVMNVPDGANTNVWRWQVNVGNRRSAYQPT